MLSIATYDINEDGVEEIIVGRDDGCVDVYAFEDGSNGPVSIMSHVCFISLLLCCFNYTKRLPAAVTNIVGGKVRGESEELIVATYNGFVLGLTPGDAPQQQLTRQKIDEYVSSSFLHEFIMF